MINVHSYKGFLIAQRLDGTFEIRDDDGEPVYWYLYSVEEGEEYIDICLENSI